MQCTCIYSCNCSHCLLCHFSKASKTDESNTVQTLPTSKHRFMCTVCNVCVLYSVLGLHPQSLYRAGTSYFALVRPVSAWNKLFYFWEGGGGGRGGGRCETLLREASKVACLENGIFATYFAYIILMPCMFA